MSLFIVLHPEDYDCYTVDVPYPVNVESKGVFWREYNELFNKSREGLLYEWQSASFNYLGLDFEAYPNSELYVNHSRKPSLYTLEEWIGKSGKNFK